MERAPVRAATALGLGLALLAPAAASAQQRQEAKTCLEHVELIQRRLDDREEILDPRTSEGINRPNLSHLVEAARRFALQGQEERCFEVVEDMAGYLGRLADTPEVDVGGSSVVPDQYPAFDQEPDGEGYPGVREEPGVEEFAEPALGEPEELEEAGLEETAEALRGEAGEDEFGVLADPDPARREGVSPVAPLEPGLEREGRIPPTSTLADNTLANLRVDEVIGMPLINNWGREIGNIVDLVVAEREPGAVYAVIAEGDAPGVAGDTGVVPLERLRVAHPKAIQLRVDEDAEGEAGGVQGLADLPAYDPEWYEPLPRTRLLGEAIGAGGMTVE